MGRQHLETLISTQWDFRPKEKELFPHAAPSPLRMKTEATGDAEDGSSLRVAPALEAGTERTPDPSALG